MKSKCCNKPLRLSRENPESGETMYYICDGCNQPADPKCDHSDLIMCNECTDTFNDEYELTDEQLHADDYVDKNYPDEKEVSKLKEASMQNEPQLSAEMEKRFNEAFPNEESGYLNKQGEYVHLFNPAVDTKEIKTFLATALEEQKQEFINQKANQHDAMVRVDERAKVLSEVDGWLDEMKKYDWGDLTDYETHEVGIPKGYKRAVNELVAKLNQLKGEE